MAWIFVVVAATVIFILVPAAQSVRARQSYWTELAERYRFQGPFEERTWTVSAGFPRGAAYDRVKLGADAEGLYLSVVGVMHSLQPPLRIPWADVEIRERRWAAFNVASMYLGPRRHQVTLMGAARWELGFDQIDVEFTSHVLAFYDAARERPRPAAS